MQDLQGFQYYDPSPLLTPKPWWKRQRTWMLFGAALVSALIAAFVVVGVVNFLKNRAWSPDKEIMQQVTTVESQLSANCQADDQICLARARSDAARSLGVSQACLGLEAEALTNCVTLIAQDKHDPEACTVLTDDNRSHCQDSAYLLLAKESVDLKVCDKISSSATRGACQFTVSNMLVNQGKCTEARVDQGVCDAKSVLKMAIIEGTSESCNALESSDLQEECTAAITTIDHDDDGLALSDEVELGLSDAIADGDGDGLNDGDEVHVHTTNPANSDTDGDGFSDGTEVASGYDPLK